MFTGGTEDGNASLDDSDQPSRMTAKKRALLDASNDTKKLKTDLSNVLKMLSSIVENKYKPDPMAQFDKIFDNVVKLNQALNDKESLNSMSPRTREKYGSMLQARRKRYIEKMLELDAKENESYMKRELVFNVTPDKGKVCVNSTKQKETVHREDVGAGSQGNESDTIY